MLWAAIILLALVGLVSLLDTEGGCGCLVVIIFAALILAAFGLV